MWIWTPPPPPTPVAVSMLRLVDVQGNTHVVCRLAPFPVTKTGRRTGKHSCDVCRLAPFPVTKTGRRRETLMWCVWIGPSCG